MPELPEVETVRRTLLNLVQGKTIRDIDVFLPKIIQHIPMEKFISELTDRTINDMGRYGKYLFFHFGDKTLISHLRMEGKYFIKPLDAKKEKHEHIIFYFTDGTTLRYHDTRQFGTMEIVPTNQIFDIPPISKLGYEPFDKQMNTTYLSSKLKNKTIAIKPALLDQHIIVGLGNIYVDEVLFRSKLHPETPCHKLSRKDIKAIIENSKDVLNKAINLGGTTIRSYVSSLGVTGRFQNELFVHSLEDELCKICNTSIVKIKVAGRGTYYCPSCQKFK
jgi:formamidopyrimidine-DNA glycosylase